jgi:hypothetical protein
MKKIIIVAALLTMSVFSIPAKAQISLNINIGSQPLWGPTGYDHVDYYYIPAIDAYYYVPSGQYIYLTNGRWTWNRNLPPAYGNFNLYNAYKVVINKPKPYMQHNTYVRQYSKYKNWSGKQTVIRDSRDNRYSVVKGHSLYKSNGRGTPSRDDNRPASRPNNNRPAVRPNNDRGNRPENNRENNSRPERKDHPEQRGGRG